MKIKEINESISSAINLSFGDDVVFNPGSATPVEFKAFFENAFIEINGVSSLKPILKNVVLSNLGKTPDNSDTLEINENNYSIVDIQNDGIGTAIFILESI